jgi:hypothetical protein
MTAAGNLIKGSRWRLAVERWLQAAGYRTTTRSIGAAGDDVFARRFTSGGWELQLSVEAKNHRAITLAEFIDQAERQAQSYPADQGVLPVVVAHRKGKADPDDAYVLMPGWAFIELTTR